MLMHVNISLENTLVDISFLIIECALVNFEWSQSNPQPVDSLEFISSISTKFFIIKLVMELMILEMNLLCDLT